MLTKKRYTLSLILALLLALSATSVLAANPHFVTARASGPDAAGGLTVNFKIAGLGNNITTTITAGADASALYACRNNGGNFPRDPKKQQVSGPVSRSGQFTSGRNGQITGSLTFYPPPTSLTCPPGQSPALVRVTYTNVYVRESHAGLFSIPGTFTRTYYKLRK
jgi:hypothetical protein